MIREDHPSHMFMPARNGGFQGQNFGMDYPTIDQIMEMQRNDRMHDMLMILRGDVGFDGYATEADRVREEP